MGIRRSSLVSARRHGTRSSPTSRGLREARFDLIWLPPPSDAGEMQRRYNPKEYFNLYNSYGGFAITAGC